VLLVARKREPRVVESECIAGAYRLLIGAGHPPKPGHSRERGLRFVRRSTRFFVPYQEDLLEELGALDRTGGADVAVQSKWRRS
jgi:hypothetical protein